MDQGNDKPFKTIEVVDSRTNQVCKVACMSCIRGHRTTSCGIPVCRNKIFWTVKRPGRPSNSCTCRYGAIGGCKCVVARSACPHKAKKGEKRSGECRCDEQGRYCCLIEPDHWTALFALQKPTVEFCPTREDLETKHAASAPIQHLAPSPGHMMANSPCIMSVPSTPGPTVRMLPPQIMISPYDGISPQSSSLTPRFGMMGIGAAQGSQHDIPLNVLAWNGNVPPAPRDHQPSYTNNSQVEFASPHPMSEFPYPQPQAQHSSALPPTFDSLGDLNSSHATAIATILATTQPPMFDMQKMQADFDRHRLPSAICQSCGYSGCNCKACPPLFQNPFTGSWAQCCGRKHAREPQTTPEPRKIARSSDYDGSQGIYAHAQSQQGQGAGGGCCGSSSEQQVINNHESSAYQQPTGGGAGCCGSSSVITNNSRGDHAFQPDHAYTENGFEHSPNMIPTDFGQYTLDNDFVMPDLNGHVDFSDYLDLPFEPAQPPDHRGEVLSGGTLGVAATWSPPPTNNLGEEPPDGDKLVTAHHDRGEELPPGTSTRGAGGCCSCSGGGGAT